jgi:tetratricopeptide (TPR) repeat protein
VRRARRPFSSERKLVVRHLSLLALAAVGLTAAAQPPAPPLSDTRLTVHTLVREDIFAGVLDGDLDRLARGEKSIEALLEKRPADKAGLLAWKASALLYRAVRAHEAGRTDEFKEKYAQVIDLLAQAKKLGPNDTGVAAATGGMYAVLADRLPEELRGRAWATAYDAYQALWKEQARGLEMLPPHMRGELLAGLALSAERTGRPKESVEYLDKILAAAPDTAYARAARKWKDDLAAAAGTRLTCLSCHAAGRLAAQQAALGEK